MANNLVKLLPDSYVQYELICRHVKVQTLSCRDRKKLLAKILYDERPLPPVKLNSYLTSDVDCAEVQRFFKKLQDEYDTNGKGSGEFILDCLNFLRIRIGRIKPFDDLQRVLLHDVSQRMVRLESELEDVLIDFSDSVSELSFGVNPSGEVCNLVTLKDEMVGGAQAVSCTVHGNALNRLKVPVHKWGIKFSGKEGTLSPMDFINRISDYQLSKHVTDEELFSSFSDLLEGHAYTWFRSLRNLGVKAPCTWVDLKGKLLQDFEKNLQDFMFDLEHSIRLCVQTSSSSVIVFFALI